MDELRKVLLAFLVGIFSLNLYALDLKAHSIKRISTILAATQKVDKTNSKVQLIVNQLADYPFLVARGANNPIYRLDGFDCQTFVQTTMALLHAHTVNEFDRNYIKVAYGALKQFADNPVQFYNRNHFVESDLNQINRKNGWFKDVTSTSPFAKKISLTIDKQRWLAFQGRNFVTKKQAVTISYIPKNLLILPRAEGGYKPNKELFSQIETPSIVEIINDPSKWRFGEKTIKDIIGTELSVSHIGVLYRENFAKGEVIYHRIICGLDYNNRKTCETIAIRCEQPTCNELMMAHATREYPNGYYWYQVGGQYTCAAQPPARGFYTQCNRVEKLPLFAYLTNYHYGSYWNMENPALLGIHVELLTNQSQN